MKHWYLLYCKSKQEARAFSNLKQQGISAFYPIIIRRKTAASKIIKQPLFPRYLFVQLDPTSANFSAIKYTRGISDFVRFGGRIRQVPEDIVNQLIAKQDSIERHDFEHGDKVLLDNDYYNNVEAIYQQADGETRSVLLIKLLNQGVELTAENNDFRAAV